MKYWFFDGNDVVGPFSPQELLRRADFSVGSSLVCPENFSEDEDSWKTASSFADFQPSSSANLPSAAARAESSAAAEAGASSQEEADLFDKEMDTFLKNPSILAGTAEPAPDGPPLELPKKPAKPGPIEDYFNNINGEDLGDILGIPDPNENSDMNLARALEGQFEQTAPPMDKDIDAVESAEDEPEEDQTDDTQEDPLPPAQETESLPSGPSSSPAPQNTPVQKEVSAPEVPAPPQPEDAPALPEQQTHDSGFKEPAPVVPVPMSDSGEEPLLILPGEQSSSDAQPAPKEPETVQAEDAVGPSAQPEPETPLEPVSEEKTSPSVPAGPEPLEAVEPSTCTLPLVREGENLSLLPSVPEDGLVSPDNAPVTFGPEDFTPEEPSAPAPEPVQPEPKETVEPESAPAVSQEPEELVPSSSVDASKTEEVSSPAPETPKEVSAAEDPKEQTVRDILRGKLTLPAEEELKEPLKTVPVEPELNQVKPRLNQTPEIEKFLDTQSRILRRSHNKKASFMLWVLSALLAVGVILASLHFFASASAPEREAAPAEVPAPVQEPAAPVRAALESPEPQTVPVPPKPRPSASDRAMAAVQNHRLAGGKGTIASYFDRLYASQLQQGYTGVWSAEPLHKNIYIVKYRLSKTRMEPVVYVFQADAAQGKLTGALNNAALDLVGKI